MFSLASKAMSIWVYVRSWNPAAASAIRPSFEPHAIYCEHVDRRLVSLKSFEKTKWSPGD